MPDTLTSASPDADEEQEIRCEVCDNTADYCYCQRCRARYCDALVESTCENCERCESCCECSYCESCDERVTDYCADCEYCSACCNCESESRLIHDYSYMPSEITFHDLVDGHVKRQYSASRAPDGAAYLGLEIETEAVHGDPETIAEIWSEYSPFGYAKHDGSLSDGVECVSHPYTYAALRQGDQLGKTLVKMAKSGARAWGTGTCGLHIHVSRRTFAHRSHMWRFVRALDSLQEELIKLAGRDSREWASWETDGPERDIYGPDPTALSYRYSARPPATKIVAGKAGNGTRYRAINMDNKHTIELRFWRGSLAPHAVYGAAAITDALVEWTRHMTFRKVRQGLTWLDFKVWARLNLPDQQYEDITTLEYKRGLGSRDTDDNEETLECAS